MDTAKLSLDAPERLAALRDSGLVEPSFEPSLDRLTKLATLVLNVPVALISLVEKDRQFFKSQCGLPETVANARETPLSHSFCQHVATSGEPLVVTDARQHPLVCDNPAVRDFDVIAYAGVPITDPDGYTLGSFCAIDTKPRQWSRDDVELIRTLSLQVSAELQLRAQSFALADDLSKQRVIEADRRTMMQLNVHDLRTPLSALLLGLDIVTRLGPLNPEQQEYLRISRRNGEALLNMVNNLLDIGMIERSGNAALRLTACRPSDLMDAATEQIQPLANEKNITLQIHSDPTLPMIHVDTDKLIRVLVNLLGNAVKFTNQSGHVHVTASKSGDVANAVQFAVSDNGIGMSDTRNIFDEGIKLDDRASTHRSTGLGLTYCKRIVEAHGGRIWFESQLEKGSTFLFTIPASS